MDKNQIVTVGNGHKVTVDDILFGYDLLFENRNMFLQTRWLGVMNMQDPTDAIKIAEYIWDYKPEAIIELGTNNGGGALFYATIVDMFSGDAPIITIDPVHYRNNTKCHANYPCTMPDEHRVWKSHVHFLMGDPINMIAEVKQILGSRKKVFLIEDSTHHSKTVLRNLESFHHFVGINGVILVQDTKLDRLNPYNLYSGGGPFSAVNQFIRHHHDFDIDRSFENLLYTQHACGWLRRTNGTRARTNINMTN